MKAPHPRWVPEPPNPEAVPKTSSSPADAPEEQIGLFRDVLEALERRCVPYAVSGAFALRQHTGICRQTKDLDLFVTAGNCPAALQCLRESGMVCDVLDPVWLAKAKRGEYFVDLITGMSNGVIVVEDSWIERAQPAVVFGADLPRAEAAGLAGGRDQREARVVAEGQVIAVIHDGAAADAVLNLMT